jgi:hypothetical protein
LAGSSTVQGKPSAPRIQEIALNDTVPERAADPAKESSRQVRPRTAEDIGNEETAVRLALRIWAAMVAQKVLSGMSALMDELIHAPA